MTRFEFYTIVAVLAKIAELYILMWVCIIFLVYVAIRTMLEDYKRGMYK